MSLLTLYNNEVKEKGFVEDALQRHAIELLSNLQKQLEKKEKRSFFEKTFLKKQKIKGLYLYGGVGRGKSFVMDLFFYALKTPKKTRLHFHEFMRMVHEYIHLNKGRIGLDQALPEFAKDFAKNTQILCFDEFHVTDIADAMILGRLFEQLWLRGVVVVATSNWAPKDLYKDGLQRDLFLPFIQSLQGKMDVYNLDGGIDYRLEKIKGEDLYFYPLSKEAEDKMNAMFDVLTEGHQVIDRILKVKGHDLVIPYQSEHRVARFDYKDILTKDYAALDFLELASHYEVIMIDRLKQWSRDEKNEVKRFMILVDALYDQGRKLIISASVPMQDLYKEGALLFEFERTLSRLQEMQSIDYALDKD